ncbi:MAG: ATP-binding cassette domain-containing protein [Burkholderiaceae bacterium]|nr:ATP-binding cassette domain-containing protein [Burkholderiaceae bacterium]
MGSLAATARGCAVLKVHLQQTLPNPLSIQLEIDAGELHALVGPSGSGKTSILRSIAGLHHPEFGFIECDHAVWLNRDPARGSMMTMPPNQRSCGFLFQQYALFPHLSALDNVCMALYNTISDPQMRRTEAQRWLDELNIGELGERLPKQLSGGQQQRVALARALARSPKMLLLDEPFGALDAKVRKELRRWLRRLHDDLHVTTIFVTHDQEEALEVSDRVVLMNSGVIEQVGTPNDVWEHPASSFVYGFLGNVNLFHGRAHQGEMSVGGIQIPTPEHQGGEARRAQAYVRPHELQIDRYVEGASGIDSRVHRAIVVGPIARIELNTQIKNAEGIPETIEVQLLAEEYRDLELQEGDRVLVYPKRARVFVE